MCKNGLKQEWTIFFLIKKEGTKESKTKQLNLILSAGQELPYCRIKNNSEEYIQANF